MENIQLNETDYTQIHTLGNVAGILPDPALTEAYSGFLFLNSSAHLSAHCRDVQHPVSPEQLSTFDNSLHSTLGDNGNVTMGGVAVVALALAMLIDNLSKKVKNQNGTTNFIQKIFRDEEGGGISEMGTIIGDYLKLIQQSTNDDQRMKEGKKCYEEGFNITVTCRLKRCDDLQNITLKEWTVIVHDSLFQFHMRVQRVRLGENIQPDLFTEDGETSLPDELVENLRAISPELQELIDRCKDDCGFIFYLIGPMKKMLECPERLLKQHDDFL